jgi:hypothetical protein
MWASSVCTSVCWGGESRELHELQKSCDLKCSSTNSHSIHYNRLLLLSHISIGSSDTHIYLPALFFGCIFSVTKNPKTKSIYIYIYIYTDQKYFKQNPNFPNPNSTWGDGWGGSYLCTYFKNISKSLLFAPFSCGREQNGLWVFNLLYVLVWWYLKP